MTRYFSKDKPETLQFLVTKSIRCQKEQMYTAILLYSNKKVFPHPFRTQKNDNNLEIFCYFDTKLLKNRCVHFIDQQNIICMSKKIKFFIRQSESPPPEMLSLPRGLHLSTQGLKHNFRELTLLKQRIKQLEKKVVSLQFRISASRKRIRRKSSEVQKKFQCDQCKKQYGSIVSLNLHLRLKHTKQREDLEAQAKQQDLLKDSFMSK